MRSQLIIALCQTILEACSTAPPATDSAAPGNPAGAAPGNDSGGAAAVNGSGGTASEPQAGGASGAAGGDTEASGPRFLPPDGRTLLVLGQDLGSLEEYTDEVWSSPAGVTSYTRIEPAPPYLPGLTALVNEGAGDLDASELLTRYPASVLALGLYLVDNTGDHLANVATGELDAAIDELGAFIRAAQRPVFLRIGYEFDGMWNHYEPELYRAAFRHIVERLRQQRVENFASVWQSATYALGTYKNLPIDAWYPGDDVVDWCGESYFKFSSGPHRALLDFARAHEKPVMIAEAAPQGYELDELTYSDDGGTFAAKTAQQIWDEWYAPLFDYVAQNSDVVRALAYINCDWASQPMWGPTGGNGYWGDTRVQGSPDIEQLWLAQISTSTWLHGSPDLFGLLE